MGGFLGDITEKLVGSSAVEQAGKAAIEATHTGFGAIEKMAPEWGPKINKYMLRAQEAFEMKAGPAAEWFSQQAEGLSKEEKSSVHPYMEAKATAASQPAAQRGDAISQKYSLMQDEFERRGLADPKNRVPNYAPRVVDPSEYEPHKYENTVKSIMAKNGVSRAKALEILSHFRVGGNKAGNFEIPRRTDEVNYRKDFGVLSEVYISGLKRLSHEEWFGKKDEVINDFIDKLTKETGDKHVGDFARRTYGHFLGRSLVNDPLKTGLNTSDAEQAYTSMMAADKLGHAVTAHSNLALNTLFMHGIGPFAKAAAQAAFDSGDARKFAVDAGALVTQSIAELAREEGPPKPLVQQLGTKVLEAQSFFKAKNFFKILSANAGKMGAAEDAEALLKNPTSKLYRYRLARLGLDPADVIANKGLSKEMELQAGKRTADITQFRQDVTSMPLWFRETTGGRMATMFKTYMYQQSRFLLQQVVQPALIHNDWRPLSYLALVAPFAAEPLADLRELVTGNYDRRPPWKYPLDRLVDNLLTSATLGMFYEVPQALSYPGESMLWKTVLSNLFVPTPAVQVAGSIVTGASALHSKHPMANLGKAIERRAVADIPFFGSYAYHKAFPPKKPRSGFLQGGGLTRGAEKLLGIGE